MVKIKSFLIFSILGAIIKLFLRVLATIDLIAGFALLFRDFNILGIGLLIVGLIMVGKGVLSLFADPLGKFYGAIDIVSGGMLIFSWTVVPINIVFFIILLYKGIISFI